MKRWWTLCLAALLLGLLGGCAGTSGYPQGNFVVNVADETWNPPLAWFNTSSGTLYVWAFQSQEDVTQPYLEFVIPEAAIGTYYLGAPGGSTPWAVYGPDQTVSHGYWTFSPPSGILDLTTLSATQCAGTFHFKGKNPGTSTTIKLTSGAFSVGLGPLQP